MPVVNAVVIAMLMALPAPAPASASASAEDIEFWVWQEGLHVAPLDPNVGEAFATNFGAKGPLGAMVAVTIDVSGLDSSRVTGTVDRGGGDPGCVTSGTRIRCEWTIGSFTSRSFGDILVRAAPGAALGPAGKVRLSGQRLDETDPNPANNTAEAVVDIRGPGRSNFNVLVADARGSVGDTVTVPVSIVNAGPNTLREVILHRPTAGGGRDFKGGNGCVTSPVPRCAVEPVPPGTTKVVNLRFHIRRCFQPVPSDPDFGASTLGDIGLRYNYSDHLNLQAVNTMFELKVNGCAQPAGTGRPSAPAVPSPSVSAAETGPSPAAVPSEPRALAAAAPPPVAARPVDRTTLLASQATFALFALAIIVVLLWRLRQRRGGL